MDGKKMFGFGSNKLMLLLLALAMIFLSGCVQNIGQLKNQDSIYDNFNDYWGPWLTPVYAAIGIGVGIYVLSYFYASFMQDEKIKAWVKGELFQLVYTVLILAFIVFFLDYVAQASVLLPAYTPVHDQAVGQQWEKYVVTRCQMDITGMERPCHIRIAEDYMQILAKSSQAQMQSILRINSLLMVLETVTIEFHGMPDPAGILYITPLVGLGTVSDTLNFAMDLLMKNYLTVRGQQFIIDFIHLGFFPFFVALGIFLRTMYFTRRLGGLLIALGVCLYLVFPMMYVFWHAVLFSFAGPWDYADYSSADTFDVVGMQMFRLDVSRGNNTMPIVKPVQGGPGYDEPTGFAAYTKSKGEYCADYIWHPWEECNEAYFAIDSTDPLKRTINKSLVCPAGKVCNTNKCQCVDEFVDTGDFRDKYLQGKSRNVTASEYAKVVAEMCYAPYERGEDLDSAQKDRSTRMLNSNNLLWYEKLRDGYGGALSASFATDKLLGANGVLDNLAKILIFSLLAPFVSIMVTLASVKILSTSLGGDVEIAGLSRLI